MSRSEDERVLVCPETKLPIRAEKLLLRAGIAHSTKPNNDSNKSHRNTSGGVSWWNFGPSLSSSSATTTGGSGVKGTRPILHLLTKPPLESSSSPLSILADVGVYAKFEFRILVGWEGESCVCD